MVRYARAAPLSFNGDREVSRRFGTKAFGWARLNGG
jgi:hypothetical protein